MPLAFFRNLFGFFSGYSDTLVNCLYTIRRHTRIHVPDAVLFTCQIVKKIRLVKSLALDVF